MQRIAVIDYGMGNLRSVAKAIEHVVSDDVEVVVTSDRSVILDSNRVVCPGQGAAEDCMSQLQQYGMDEAVVSVIDQGVPFLGICMGLQVLLSSSEENGGTSCLNIVPGVARGFPGDLAEFGSRLKIPHMGWNQVEHTRDHALWDNIENNARFYFCHSFYVDPEDKAASVGKCHYGIEFTAALASRNIFACQFHPEKSATVGLQLLHNFCRWNGTILPI